MTTALLRALLFGLVASVYADPMPVTISMPSGEELEAMYALAVSLTESQLVECQGDTSRECSQYEAAVAAAKKALDFYKANEESTFTIPMWATTNPTTIMPEKVCQKGEKECCNGKCIRGQYAQDGEDDCGDNSDEKLACGFAPKTTTGAPAAIDVNELVGCALSQCTIQALSCVGSPTCMGLVLDLASGMDLSGDVDSILAQAFAKAEGDDAAKSLIDCAVEGCLEHLGGKPGKPSVPTMGPQGCGEHEAECCNGYCVSLRYFSDGDNDCGDWSDEKALCGFEDAENKVNDLGDDDDDDGWNLFGSGFGFGGYDDDIWTMDWSWSGNEEWEECEDGESPFRDIHDACQQDCTYNKGSRGLVGDDGYAYDDDGGYYGYDDDDGWSGGMWGDIFDTFFGGDDDDGKDDKDDLEMCAVDQSDYGVACTQPKSGSKKCQKAINKLSIGEVHHYVNQCHGKMPYLFESTATTIPEIIAFYRGLSDKCGATLSEVNFPMPGQTVLHLMLKEAQRKVAAHCLTDKPDYELGHCFALEEEIKQYKTQVKPEIAAAANLQSQLDVAKANAEACSNDCNSLLSQIADMEEQLSKARAAENSVLAASKSGTSPSTPDGTKSNGNGNLIGIIVGVVGCVLGLIVAVFFAVRSSSTTPPATVVVHQGQGIVNPGADAFDNPNYDPNAREMEEPAYEDMGDAAEQPYDSASNAAGYMDVSPMADAEA